MTHKIFYYLLAYTVGMLCIGLVLFFVVLFTGPEISEREMCSGYKYQKMQDVPAYCIKYFQE